MRAGRLRHRIALQQPVESTDTFGQPVITWTTVATVWGAVEPLRGQELFTAQQINAETTVRVVIRYRSDIDQTWRISFDSRLYNIEELINPREYGAELQMLCSEGINDG